MAKRGDNGCVSDLAKCDGYCDKTVKKIVVVDLKGKDSDLGDVKAHTWTEAGAVQGRTKMTDIKAWLSRAKHIDDEINALLKEQERALTRATGAVPAAKGERVQTTPQNGSEDRFIAYAEYSRIIDERIDELYAVKCEIFKAISRIEDGTPRTLLELRYLGFKTWEEIAVEMNYSYKHVVHGLHPKALKKVKEVIECNTDPML